MSRRIAVFMGTRPEAIKMAPVVAALRAADGMTPVVVNSGQHREMIQQVIDLFDISVDADLQAMAPDQTLAGLTARLVERADRALAELGGRDVENTEHMVTETLIRGMYRYWREVMEAT